VEFTDRKYLTTVKNKAGEEFELSWRKWREPDDANYRFYVVEAKHKNWGVMPFSVMVTKAAFPTEEFAFGVVNGDALQSIRVRLEDVTGDGRLLLLPDLRKGWTLVV
jgi:hypothetical protein